MFRWTRTESGDEIVAWRAPAEPWDGARVDLDRFWAEAWSELQERQQALSRDLKLGNAQWKVDQEAGLIEFERADGQRLRSPVQIIGGYNGRREVFSWAWDHPSVHPRLRAAAERTRWFGQAHALHDLTKPQVKASEGDAWRFAAVARKVNAAFGVYRAPTDGPVVFMIMGEPTFDRSRAP